MPQTMMIPDAKAAVDKRIGKARKIASIANDQSQEQKREAIKEAQKEERTVRSGTLMDICHLKNSELGPQFQKDKGQVVLRGDTVKDDSGSHAVFTDQGSSASQMTAAKVMDVITKATRMCRTSSCCSIRLYPNQNGGCSQIAQNSKVRMSMYLDTSTTTQVAKILVQH